MTCSRGCCATPAEHYRSLRFGAVTRTRVREGRAHPESGKPFKAVTDEASNTQTFHNTGDTERVDVLMRPETVYMEAPQ